MRYAGATAKIDRDGLAELGSRFVVQPKLDGCYGLIQTDATGAIASITTRAGKQLGPNLLAHFAGVRWAPDSIVVGEVELWTETSDCAAAERGYRRAYLFDAHVVGGRDVSALRYADRRDVLMRAEAELVCADPDRPWHEDATGRAHDLESGEFTRRTPLGWRRVMVAPQLPARLATDAWHAWVARQEVGPCEGLVAVALDAPLGGRAAKRKCKLVDTIDVVVSAVDARAIAAYWPAAQRSISLPRPLSLGVAPGDVLEVVHEGFYDSGEPRFARVARQRPDLN